MFHIQTVLPRAATTKSKCWNATLTDTETLNGSEIGFFIAFLTKTSLRLKAKRYGNMDKSSTYPHFHTSATTIYWFTYIHIYQYLQNITAQFQHMGELKPQQLTKSPIDKEPEIRNLKSPQRRKKTGQFRRYLNRPVCLAPPVGLEPTTLRLTAACSTDWAKEEYSRTD